MKAIHRLFVTALAVCIVLATSLAVFLFIALVPYRSIIGLTAAIVVMIGLLCVAVLMLAYTGNKIGAWSMRKRLLVAGEVVVFMASDGSYIHLSAEHEQAKLPLQRITPAKDESASDETILDLYDKGLTLMDIADKCHTSYYRVQKLTSGKR